MVGGVGGAGLSLRWGAAPATAVGIPKKKKRKEMKNKRGKPFIFLKKNPRSLPKAIQHLFSCSFLFPDPPLCAQSLC